VGETCKPCRGESSRFLTSCCLLDEQLDHKVMTMATEGAVPAATASARSTKCNAMLGCVLALVASCDTVAALGPGSGARAFALPHSTRARRWNQVAPASALACQRPCAARVPLSRKTWHRGSGCFLRPSLKLRFCTPVEVQATAAGPCAFADVIRAWLHAEQVPLKQVCLSSLLHTSILSP